METPFLAASGRQRPSLHELLDLVEEHLQPPCHDESADAVADRLGRIDIAYRRINDARQLFFAAFAEWLGSHGDLVIGDVRWYAGVEKDWRCLDKALTIEALLDLVGGDVAELCAFLVAKPFKPGSCKGCLPSRDFDRLFVREARCTAKTGKPKKPAAIKGRVRP